MESLVLVKRVIRDQNRKLGTPVRRIVIPELVERATCLESAKVRARIQAPCVECVKVDEAFVAAGQ